MTARHRIRDIGLKFTPFLMSQLLAWRSQRLIIRQEAETGLTDASKRFVGVNGATVLEGPFAGLRYPSATVRNRNLIGKLLGAYESELHPWVERMVEANHSQILNVGSADGYYTVGLAVRLPQTKVIAFDTDPWARRATRNLARENAVDSVNVKTICTPAWLSENLRRGSLVVVDCEGCEETLLDPKIAPNLLRSDILVELHEHVVPGIGSLIRTRFGATHDIEEVTSEKKDPDHFPRLRELDYDLATQAISEGRAVSQSWLLLVSRSP